MVLTGSLHALRTAWGLLCVLGRLEPSVSGELFDFIIFLIIVCLLAAVVLWAIRRFFADVYEPARYIVGALALIAILVKLRPIIVALMS